MKTAIPKAVYQQHKADYQYSFINKSHFPVHSYKNFSKFGIETQPF